VYSSPEVVLFNCHADLAASPFNVAGSRKRCQRNLARDFSRVKSRRLRAKTGEDLETAQIGPEFAGFLAVLEFWREYP